MLPSSHGWEVGEKKGRDRLFVYCVECATEGFGKNYRKEETPNLCEKGGVYTSIGLGRKVDEMHAAAQRRKNRVGQERRS